MPHNVTSQFGSPHTYCMVFMTVHLDDGRNMAVMLSRVASHCWSDLANYISSAYPPIVGVVDQRDECGGLVLELDKLKGQA